MTSTRELSGAGKSASSNGASQAETERAELARLRAEVAEWRRRFEKGGKRDIAFVNSEREVEPLYTALDVGDPLGAALGTPGAYPYTRGIHPTGYRGKLWTMRQFAGFG